MGRWQRIVMMTVLVCCGLSISLIFTAIGPVLSSLSARYGGGLHGDVIATPFPAISRLNPLPA